MRAHGYIKRGSKWLYPQSSTGLPGVTVSDEGRVYSHHGADPLANGHQNDAFEVFCLLEHSGDQSRAVKAAAQLLGMQHASRPDPRDLPPSPSENMSEPSHFGAPASEAAPDPQGGAGGAGDPVALTIDQVLRRYALVDGTTHIWDLDQSKVMKKSAFEARVGKPMAKQWLEDTEHRKLISGDHVSEIEQARRMAGKKGGAFGMSPTERYVYIDGTKDVWDREKKRRIAEGAVKMALGDTYPLWLNSAERRVVDVDHIVFDPTMTKDPSIYINTFDGLPLEPVRDDDACANLRWLIKFLCNGEDDAAWWLTRWLAYPLQHLGAKMDTAVLMHSIMEGSGKSLLFADALGMLYGQYAATVGQTQLESNFNAWQSRKLWAVFEEVVSRDQRYNQVGKIKHLITGKTVRMESKFINGWEESNHMNAVFLSNEILPWPISDLFDWTPLGMIINNWEPIVGFFKKLWDRVRPILEPMMKMLGMDADGEGLIKKATNVANNFAEEQTKRNAGVGGGTGALLQADATQVAKGRQSLNNQTFGIDNSQLLRSPGQLPPSGSLLQQTAAANAQKVNGELTINLNGAPPGTTVDQPKTNQPGLKIKPKVGTRTVGVMKE